MKAPIRTNRLPLIIQVHTDSPKNTAPPIESKSTSTVDVLLKWGDLVLKTGWILLGALLLFFAYSWRQRLIEAVEAYTVTEINIYGIKANLLEHKVAEFYEPKRTREANEFTMTEEQQKKLLDRAKRLRKELQGASILWLDDHPMENDKPRLLLQYLGVTIYYATTKKDALQAIEQYAKDSTAGKQYDLIISDMTRMEPSATETDSKVLIQDDNAGTEFAAANAAHKFYNGPIIIFTTDIAKVNQGPTAGVYAITNRPDHLLHYVFDVIERGDTPARREGPR